MPRWKQLAADLASWLEPFQQSGVEFRNPNQAIPGFPWDGFRSDGVLTNGRDLLAVEVEAGQTHPDTNVGKYWLLYTRKRYEKILLIHVYTPAFDSYGWRKALGEFYAQRMTSEVPLEYLLLDYRSATDYHATLQQAKAEIQPRIKQMFGLGGHRPQRT